MSVTMAASGSGRGDALSMRVGGPRRPALVRTDDRPASSPHVSRVRGRTTSAKTFCVSVRDRRAPVAPKSVEGMTARAAPNATVLPRPPGARLVSACADERLGMTTQAGESTLEKEAVACPPSSPLRTAPFRVDEHPVRIVPVDHRVAASPSEDVRPATPRPCSARAVVLSPSRITAGCVGCCENTCRRRGEARFRMREHAAPVAAAFSDTPPSQSASQSRRVTGAWRRVPTSPPEWTPLPSIVSSSRNAAPEAVTAQR